MLLVKVEVAEEDFERAREVLDLPKEKSGLLKCPKCGSENISVRQMNLLFALGLIFLNLILPHRKNEADCLDCGETFKV
jgi:Zn finger protein HypA/HybF involved in hydrogenase expression